MFLGALLCLAMVGDATSPTNNGVYVSSEGYVFTVLNPHTIWATLGRRYHSAYSLTKTSDTSYQGKYDASNIMRPGYDPDPQISAQYDLLAEASGALPANLIKVPAAIPCVPAPAASATGDFGVIKVDQKPGGSGLHLSWTYANGLNDFSGDATRVGGGEWIDVNGVYADVLGSMTLSEQGDGPAKVLIGTIVLEGQKYKLTGLRVWDRGTFQFSQAGSNTVAGTGWLEWSPTRSFAMKMLKGSPTPSDRIQIYVNSGTNPVSSTTIRMLKRISD